MYVERMWYTKSNKRKKSLIWQDIRQSHEIRRGCRACMEGDCDILNQIKEKIIDTMEMSYNLMGYDEGIAHAWRMIVIYQIVIYIYYLHDWKPVIIYTGCQKTFLSDLLNNFNNNIIHI